MPADTRTRTSINELLTSVRQHVKAGPARDHILDGLGDLGIERNAIRAQRDALLAAAEAVCNNASQFDNKLSDVRTTHIEALRRAIAAAKGDANAR